MILLWIWQLQIPWNSLDDIVGQPVLKSIGQELTLLWAMKSFWVSPPINRIGITRVSNWNIVHMVSFIIWMYDTSLLFLNRKIWSIPANLYSPVTVPLLSKWAKIVERFCSKISNILYRMANKIESLENFVVVLAHQIVWRTPKDTVRITSVFRRILQGPPYMSGLFSCPMPCSSAWTKYFLSWQNFFF